MHDGNKTMVDWGSRTRAGSIKVDYQTGLNNLYLVYLYKCGVW